VLSMKRGGSTSRIVSDLKKENEEGKTIAVGKRTKNCDEDFWGVVVYYDKEGGLLIPSTASRISKGGGRSLER